MKRSILLGLFFALLINMKSFATLDFITNNYWVQQGAQITIPVKVTGFTNVMSIQGSIQFDTTKLQFVSVQDLGLPGWDISQIGVSLAANGKITFSWMETNLTGINLPDSTTIFSIKLNVIGSAGQTTQVQFVNSPAVFEVLDPAMDTIAYSLVYGLITIEPSVSIPEFQNHGFQLQQNEPNPLSNETNIRFSLPEDGNVSLEIYDLMGNKVDAYHEFMQAGNRSYHLDATKLYAGTYYYRLSCGKYSEIRKMLVVR
jgi:hypothetical protein